MAEQHGQVPGVCCITCPLRQHNEWCVLTEAETRLLEGSRKSWEFAAGDAVFSVGEPSLGVYCVASGVVAIRKIDTAGHAIPTRLVYHSDIFGYRGLLLDVNRRYSAQALCPSRICFVDKSVVKTLLERNPALGQQFLHRIVADLEDAHDQLMRNATQSNRSKFLRLLLMFLSHHGRTAKDGSQYIALPLSRRDLASMIGTRQETLSRIIGRLEEDGLARFSGRTVHLPRLDSLLREIQRPSQFA